MRAGPRERTCPYSVPRIFAGRITGGMEEEKLQREAQAPRQGRYKAVTVPVLIMETDRAGSGPYGRTKEREWKTNRERVIRSGPRCQQLPGARLRRQQKEVFMQRIKAHWPVLMMVLLFEAGTFDFRLAGMGNEDATAVFLADFYIIMPLASMVTAFWYGYRMRSRWKWSIVILMGLLVILIVAFNTGELEPGGILGHVLLDDDPRRLWNGHGLLA